MTTDRDRLHRLFAESDAAGPAGEARIAAAEAALGLRFPPAYRALLERYGAALVEGFEFFGLAEPAGNGPPLWTDVVETTLALRAAGQAGFDRPGRFTFSDDGMGVYFLLDAAEPEGGVLAVGPGVERRFGMGLERFLLALSEGRIEI